MNDPLYAALTKTRDELIARNRMGHQRRLQLRHELETLEHDLAFNAGRLHQMESDLKTMQTPTTAPTS